ncbi:MAG: thiolase family protein [Gemella sp.]|nr:thiolase family protein [Gemella sp.]
MREAYIVAYGRSAVAKGSKRGALYHSRPDDVAAQVLKQVIDRVGGDFTADLVEDVIVGCAFPEGMQGQNIARTIALRAGLPIGVSGQTVNRWCSSGLQSIATAANAIIAGQADVLVAGGVEFMSTTKMMGSEPTNNPYLQDNGPSVGIPMGVTAENVAETYGVSAEEQNEFAARSHARAAAAQDNGRFKEEIVPVTANRIVKTQEGVQVEECIFDTDEGIRRETDKESLARLNTIFKVGGSVTAGNASQISDGTAFVVIVSGEMLEKLNIKPIAKFLGYKVAGLDPAIMGAGPVYAIPEVLELTGLKLDDIDLIELNEAFASQAIASIRELGINEEITNVNGGAIALGHPLGATGSILTARLLSEMSKREDSKYGMVSMCIGNGMGAAAVFEYLQDN